MIGPAGLLADPSRLQRVDAGHVSRPVRAATTGAPVFDEALAWIDCSVRHTLDLGTHTLFVGEIVDAAIRDGDARPASTQDTRMKYGGIKRH